MKTKELIKYFYGDLISQPRGSSFHFDEEC